jgi:hypothetical protein
MQAIRALLRNGLRRSCLLGEHSGDSLLEPASGSLVQRHHAPVRVIENAAPMLPSLLERDLLLPLALDDCGLRGTFCFENSIHCSRDPCHVTNRILRCLRRNTHRHIIRLENGESICRTAYLAASIPHCVPAPAGLQWIPASLMR